MLKLINQLLNKLNIKETKDSLSIKDSNTFEVKRGLHKRYLIIARELYNSSDPNSKTPHLGERRKGRLIVCLIIICFALESFVNDILQITYSTNIAEIEKEPLKDKVKRLYKTSSITTDPIYDSIIELIKARNSFAHYKPNFRNPKDNLEKLNESIDHKKIADYYANTVILMQTISKEHDLAEEFAWLTDYSNDINSAT